MEIDDEAKEIVQEVAAAINRAVENSSEVAAAIERLREAGYHFELTIRLEIGLRPVDMDDDADEDRTLDATELDLTDDDRRTLRQMRIKIDDAE